MLFLTFLKLCRTFAAEMRGTSIRIIISHRTDERGKSRDQACLDFSLQGGGRPQVKAQKLKKTQKTLACAACSLSIYLQVPCKVLDKRASPAIARLPQIALRLGSPVKKNPASLEKHPLRGIRLAVSEKLMSIPYSLILFRQGKMFFSPRGGVFLLSRLKSHRD